MVEMAEEIGGGGEGGGVWGGWGELVVWMDRWRDEQKFDRGKEKVLSKMARKAIGFI